MEIKITHSNTTPYTPQLSEKVFVIDVMASLRKINMNKLKTFGDFGHEFLKMTNVYMQLMDVLTMFSTCTDRHQ